MDPRQLRLVRAAAVSSVATVIAAVSHTFGGGAAPHPLLILALATLLTPLCALLVGRRRSRVRVTAAVGLAHAVFHLVFQALGAPTGFAGPVSAGHAHHGGLPAFDSLAPLAAADAPMLAAHAVAAALTALLVLHGEALVRGVSAWFQKLLLRAVASPPPDHDRPAALSSVLLSPFDAAVSPAVSRRGPPLLARG